MRLIVINLYEVSDMVKYKVRSWIMVNDLCKGIQCQVG